MLIELFVPSDSMVGVASTVFQETVTQELKTQIFTEPNRNQTNTRRTTIEKDKSNMLPFVLNSQAHVKFISCLLHRLNCHA